MVSRLIIGFLCLCMSVNLVVSTFKYENKKFRTYLDSESTKIKLYENFYHFGLLLSSSHAL